MDLQFRLPDSQGKLQIQSMTELCQQTEFLADTQPRPRSGKPSFTPTRLQAKGTKCSPYNYDCSCTVVVYDVKHIQDFQLTTRNDDHLDD